MKHFVQKVILIVAFFFSYQILNAQCVAGAPDADQDGVCDIEDQCPGYDDNFDIDDDGIPYHCDDCIDINENGICDNNNDPYSFGDHKVYFSKKRGFYSDDFQLELVSKIPNAQIRYTTNGTPPTTNSGTIYSGPFSITTTSFIRAIAYSGQDASKVYTHTYIFPDDVIDQPNSVSGFPTSGFAFDASIKNDNVYGNQLIDALTQIPSISLVMDLGQFNQMHQGSAEFPTSVELIFPNGEKGKQANGGIERAGGSSFNSAKRNMRLSFKSIYGESKFEYPIFGEGAAEEFDQIALRPGFHGCMHLGINHPRGGSNDIADQVVRNFQHNISNEEVSIHGNFMHLYINGIYWGVYNPTERANNGFGESYYGGEKDDWDVIKRKQAQDGNLTAWNTLNSMVANLDMSQTANYEAVQDYVNIKQFTEYVIISNFAPHSDDHPSGKNSFVNRDRTKNEGFRFWIWDTEPALGHYWTWTVADIGSVPYNNIFFSLLDNSDYRMQVGDQLECHCFNDGPLTPNKTIEEYMKVYNSTNVAMLAEAARWVTKAEYDEFINTKNRITNQYLPNRTNDFIQKYRDNNLYPSINGVEFNQYGGVVDNNFQLVLSNPNNGGTIYYTLDGSDPRASGGGINNNALTYNGAISLPSGAITVKARVKSGNTWSAMCPRLFYVDQNYTDLVINEIHYHAKDSIVGQDTISGENFEYIEIRNNGTGTIDLYNTAFTNGISLEITSSIVVPANGFAVFAEDGDWFEDKYGFAPDGVFSGKIDDDGEKIILSDPFGNIIDSVRFYNTDPWDEAPDDKNFSLELLHPDLSNDEPLNWFRSDNIGGTPKAENSRICAQAGASIMFNEINYNSNNDVLDPGNWVELFNATNQSIDLTGWTFYDSGNKFVLPQGTNIPAEGYLVLVEDQNEFASAFPNVPLDKTVGEFPFGLSKKGERISLFDPNKCLADYVIYNDKDPWPETPDGDGPSLSLIDPALDNALPESWDASNTIADYFDHGSPGQSNICSPGQGCDDGNPCTINDVFDAECNCAGTLVPDDSDNDGVCDPADVCPNFDDSLIGTPCDDGNICTVGEIYDENCGCSGGVISDIDNDGICDPLDDCNNNLEGTSCDDGDICTTGETYDENCNCTGGIFQDADNDGICDAEDICPNLENTLIGQLCDDGDSSTEFDTYNTNTCSCSGIITSAELCVKVSSSEDDAEERVDNGVVTLTSGDLDMVNDEGVIFIAGIRFQNIDIPQGASIINATIQFAADEVNLDQTDLIIRGEAIDNAPVFEAAVNNISNRSSTAANVNWQPNPWEAIGDHADHQKTIDLSPIIQEIINRPGFVQGNSIALVIEGSGIRTAESFDGSESLAPELCITYSTGQCVENYPCDDGNAATINDKFNADCECIGEDISLNAKILLEGFYDDQNNNMHTSLYDKNLIPLSQPYNAAPWNYNGDESVSSIPEGVVDWILLMTRDQDGNVIDQAAGFVTQSGEIMSIDGNLGIPINEGVGNQFSIHHRTHLAILSSSNYDGGMYDFTLAENQAAGNGQLKLVNGKYMLYAGDYDGIGIINSLDFNNWKIQGAIINQYLPIDGDGNGIVNSLDYNLWTNNKSKIGHPSIRY